MSTAMDPAPIPPRPGDLHASDRDHFKLHPSAALSDVRLPPNNVPRRVLPETARSPTTLTDALPPTSDAAVSTSADATANHHSHQHPQQNSQASPTSRPLDSYSTARTSIAPSAPTQDPPSALRRHISSVHSQDSNMSAESDNVFTPPASQGERPGGNTNGHNSSQESQLLQLSHIAAAQDKLAEGDAAATSRKRMADGMVKETTSPARIGHSRNTSTVSMASTTASTIGDDLKTRLTYALLKVNNGWQTHSIDEVESMASQAASPTSTHSTLHGRQDSSASPRTNMALYAPASAATTASSNPSPATYEAFWKEGQTSQQNSASPPAPSRNAATLAPPAPIQPSSRPLASHNPRRNSNPRYTPTLLSHSHSASPHTPGQQGMHATPSQRPLIDPILFSPHQNVREQDAIETLLFMRSPGNSANLKHSYSPSVASNLTPRHALPSSQPRKSLPSQRPIPQKRVGFEKSPSGMTTVSDMDVDMDSPQSRGPMRRRINGSASFSAGTTLRPQLSLPASLSSTSRPRPRLADADIDRMIEQAARGADSSDDDDEIEIPARNRPEGTVGT